MGLQGRPTKVFRILSLFTYSGIGRDMLTNVVETSVTNLEKAER